MFKISLIVRPGRQQNDPWILASCHAHQRIPLRSKKWRQPQHVRLAEQLRQQVGHNRSILQRVSAPRRRLRAVSKNPPLPIRRPRKIDRQHMQIAMHRDLHTHHWPQKRRVPIQQRPGKVPARQQVLRAIKILQQTTQQPRTLSHSSLDEPPLFRFNQQRHNVRLPGSIRPQRIAINVVGNPILANAPFSQRPTPRQFRRPYRSQRPDQRRPVSPRIDPISRPLVVRRSIAKC